MCISGSKTTKQFLPAALASYRAMSASRRSWVAEARTPVAMPMLAVRVSVPSRQVLEVERGPEHVDQPFGHQLGPDVHGAPVDQHDELVTAQPTDAVAAAHGHREPFGYRLQELVPDPVAEGVVDILESVEIDEQGGHLNIGPPGPGQHLLGPIEDQGPVGQTGQGVVDGLESDLVDQSGVGDGRGRLGGQPFEPLGQPGGDGQAFGLGW